MTSISGGSFGGYANQCRADNFGNQWTRGANGLQQSTVLSGNNIDTVSINQGIGTGFGVPGNQDLDRIGRMERAIDQLSLQGPRKDDMSLQELMMLKELMKDDKKEKKGFNILDPAGLFSGGGSGGGLLGGLFGG
ncbi:MAG TPA: hypothetical protein V6C52_01740 [Coleofasciculaceae cyanobacterium]|jgi:hypothetical protein